MNFTLPQSFDIIPISFFCILIPDHEERSTESDPWASGHERQDQREQREDQSEQNPTISCLQRYWGESGALFRSNVRSVRNVYRVGEGQGDASVIWDVAYSQTTGAPAARTSRFFCWFYLWPGSASHLPASCLGRSLGVGYSSSVRNIAIGACMQPRLV